MSTRALLRLIDAWSALLRRALAEDWPPERLDAEMAKVAPVAALFTEVLPCGP